MCVGWVIGQTDRQNGPGERGILVRRVLCFRGSGRWVGAVCPGSGERRGHVAQRPGLGRGGQGEAGGLGAAEDETQDLPCGGPLGGPFGTETHV